MNYCSQCSGPLSQRIPEGDHRLRYVCDGCGTIHYQNPKIVTGCIPEWEDRILLCRRAISPRRGYWTLPAGYMENGESSPEGAARETLEECGSRVKVTALYTTFDLPHIDQIYLLFRGTLLDTGFGPTEESSEVALFAEEDIPWGELAFPVVAETLKLYFADRRDGRFRHRTGKIHWENRAVRQYRTELL